MNTLIARRSLRALFALLVSLVTLRADTMLDHPHCGSDSAAPSPSLARGRVLILPGVANTRFHLAGFVERAQRQLPAFEIEVRPWGVPLLRLHNLRAYERNVATAAAIAAEIAAWREQHPNDAFYLLGYSGGGGMATLVASALPEGVVIDRLVLIAPAIAPDYPLEDDVLPHVREFVVNYASERDLQVGWGTATFGTIDRKDTVSAGAVGFANAVPRLLQRHWSSDDVAYGHPGNHLAYLGERWQRARLLPAIDPTLTADQVLARWARTCKEG